MILKSGRRFSLATQDAFAAGSASKEQTCHLRESEVYGTPDQRHRSYRRPVFEWLMKQLSERLQVQDLSEGTMSATFGRRSAQN
jgi:hypothetical protein